MDRREFSKRMLMAGIGVGAGSTLGGASPTEDSAPDVYREPAKNLPIRKFDVVVADWHRRYLEKGYDAGRRHDMQLPRDFAKPVVMVGAVAGELVRPWSKINWL